MEESIVALVLFMVGVMIFLYALPYLLVAGFGCLVYKGTVALLRYLKGELTSGDHLAGIALGAVPMAEVFYEKGWTTQGPVFVLLIPPMVWILFLLTLSLSERNPGAMDHEATDELPPSAKDRAEPAEVLLPTTTGTPLSALYTELEEILQRDDRSLLTQRLETLKRSMDATTYEKNVAAWLRKFKSAVEVMETMNRAERTRMDHDFMPLERKKKEAELKADIEHHKAREAEAKMRQRMAQED